MESNSISEQADLIIYIVALVVIAFGVGEWIGRSTERAEKLECEPGVVKSVRRLDGELVCWHERTDWRERLERRASKRKT